MNIIEDLKKTRPFVIKMASIRGYDKELSNEIFDDEELYEEMIFENSDGGKMVVHWIIEKKIKIDTVTAINDKAKEINADFAILVAGNCVVPTTRSKNLIKNCATTQDHIFQHFSVTELSFCLIDHEFVPKHKAISLAKKKKLIATLAITPDKLPKILYTDPVNKFYGWPRGTIVKIYREKETSFRIVC